MDYTSPNMSDKAKIALTEIEKQFIEMRSSGMPIRQIAETLNKSTHTICNWNKKYYKNIIEFSSDEFKTLRDKIVKFKSTRLDFLLDEFKNVKEAMAKSETLTKKNYYNYDGYLNLLMKLSKQIDDFEADLMTSSKKESDFSDSDIIEAESEDIELIPEKNPADPEKMQNNE
jgi:DNA-binding Lrp family transcriptional regulator